MDPEEAAIMDDYLADRTLTAGTIAAELSDAGYPISEGAVANYRYQRLGIKARRR
jgi:repressor of nif and glnA expression